jgi:hypothetical protein
MTTIRTVAAHEVVSATFPRPVTERDEIGMAVGKAIDETLSWSSYEFSQSRRPTLTAMNRRATEILDVELRDADVQLTAAARQHQLTSISGVMQVFRRSEIMGLARPKSRLILINEQIGVYAQPDYWNGRDRFYEMKSYRARPLPPDVQLQIRLFQCAFPGFQAYLACFDRHASPVASTIELIPPLEPAILEGTLALAYRTGLEAGKPKVLEFMDSPTVRYSIKADP